jgi:soluble lytic murein transglycosylase
MESVTPTRESVNRTRTTALAVAIAFVLFDGGAGAASAAPARARGKKAETKPEVQAAEKPVKFDRRWLEPHFASGRLSAAAEAFRRDDWRRAVTGFEAGLAKLPRNAPDRAAAQFMLATANMHLGEWTTAGALFEALYEKQPLLAPYHAHYAARCRLRRGDAEGTLLWSQKVERGAVLEAETVLLRLDALESLGRFAEIAKESQVFLERFPAGPRRAEAMFRRAEALERQNAPAPEIAALYRRIWAEAPLESWSRKAEDRLVQLVKRQPAQVQADKMGIAGSDPADLGRFTASEWLQRGMILFDRNQNEDAEAALASALTASPAGPGSQELRCKAEYHRAQSIFKQRQRTRAAPFFAQAEAACREAGNGDLTTKALYQGARCLHVMGNRACLAKYATIEKESPKHSYADDARLRRAEFLSDANEAGEAGALLSALPDLYPQGDQAGEAMWRLALAAIREKNWDEANRWLDENLKRIPHEEVWFAEGRALYWKARVALGQGGKAAALALYTRAVREYPLSVYTLLALERMRAEFPDARRKLVRELRADMVGPASLAAWKFAPRVSYGRPEFRRAVELARMGMGSDARRELHRLGPIVGARDDDDDDNRVGQNPNPKTGERAKEDPGSEREDVRWITSILLDRGRSWAAGHAIPRYHLTDYRNGYPQGKREAMWRLAYPRAFPEAVASNSKINHVPEALQLAIMREESAFNARIESFANALGLTQMLVKTAKRFNRNANREFLLDPARNLEVGSKYLALLLDRFHRKEPLVIAGYNAGEGAVDRWMGERGDLALDEFLETIPYDETRNYTKRVLASYLTYTWLYEPSRPVPELAFSLKAPPRHERVGRPAGRATRRPR